MKIKGKQLERLKQQASRLVAVSTRERLRMEKRINGVYNIWINQSFDNFNRVSASDFNWSTLDSLITDALLADSMVLIRNILVFLNNFNEYGFTITEINVLTRQIFDRHKLRLDKGATKNVSTFKKSIDRFIEANKEKFTAEVLLEQTKIKMSSQAVIRSKALSFTSSGALTATSNDVSAKKANRDLKVWIYTFIAKVPRPRHLELDGEAIPLNEKFSVNGYQARYPHDDVNLPIGERANCHCVVYYA